MLKSQLLCRYFSIFFRDFSCCETMVLPLVDLLVLVFLLAEVSPYVVFWATLVAWVSPLACLHLLRAKPPRVHLSALCWRITAIAPCAPTLATAL